MLKLNHEQIARLAHESLRQARILMFDTPMEPWANARPHHRAAMLAIVRTLSTKPRLTACEAHGEMVALRLAEGWSHGPFYDTVSKRNPLVTDWANLSPKYRSQQALVYATIRHLLYPEAEG